MYSYLFRQISLRCFNSRSAERNQTLVTPRIPRHEVQAGDQVREVGLRTLWRARVSAGPGDGEGRHGQGLHRHGQTRQGSPGGIVRRTAEDRGGPRTKERGVQAPLAVFQGVKMGEMT